jgi:hypothetical protein
LDGEGLSLFVGHVGFHCYSPLGSVVVRSAVAGLGSVAAVVAIAAVARRDGVEVG